MAAAAGTQTGMFWYPYEMQLNDKAQLQLA